MVRAASEALTSDRPANERTQWQIRQLVLCFTKKQSSDLGFFLLLLRGTHLLMPERDFVIADEDGRSHLGRISVFRPHKFCGAPDSMVRHLGRQVTLNGRALDSHDARNLALTETLRRQLRDGSVSV